MAIHDAGNRPRMGILIGGGILREVGRGIVVMTNPNDGATPVSAPTPHRKVYRWPKLHKLQDQRRPAIPSRETPVRSILVQNVAGEVPIAETRTLVF